MSDSQVENAAPPNPEAASAAKREWAAQVALEILRKMELEARIESKDAVDGGIALAVHFAQAPAGVQGGKRSNLMDSLQFVVNKMINRPGADRRWISIGVDGFPAPRPARPEKSERPVRTAPEQAQAPAPRPPAPSAPAPVRKAEPSAAPDERSMQVGPDAALSSAARQLAESSAKLGRYYAIVTMKAEDRARVLAAVKEVSGVKVGAEGEGRNRRLLWTPDRPSPMPRQRTPGIVEEEEG